MAEARHYRVSASGQVVVEPGALASSPAVQEMVRLAQELVRKTRARERHLCERCRQEVRRG